MRELKLHLFMVVVGALCLLWALYLDDAYEVTATALFWAAGHVITRILGFFGQFDKKPTDAEAGINRGGQGR